MYMAGLNPDHRPVGVILLLGVSGSGKTHLVKTLAHAIHRDPRKMLYINCGEYTAGHEVARLIGAPPGYLGHRETQPLLTQSVLNGLTTEHSSLQIVLLDEVEKAHPKFHQAWLSPFDEARLQLGDGAITNFQHTLFVLTSNLGSRALQQRFTAYSPFDSVERVVTPAKFGATVVGKEFPPEWINRLDETITCNVLGRPQYEQILTLELRAVEAQLKRRSANFVLTVTPAAREQLLEEGIHPAFGARPLKRVLKRRILQALAQKYVQGTLTPGWPITLDYDQEFSVRYSSAVKRTTA
jgi:ATP-dependent Clp protease ATP-binding subunit ClpA